MNTYGLANPRTNNLNLYAKLHLKMPTPKKRGGIP
jgi:hypothetical protein